MRACGESAVTSCTSAATSLAAWRGAEQAGRSRRRIAMMNATDLDEEDSLRYRVVDVQPVSGKKTFSRQNRLCGSQPGSPLPSWHWPGF